MSDQNARTEQVLSEMNNQEVDKASLAAQEQITDQIKLCYQTANVDLIFNFLIT